MIWQYGAMPLAPSFLIESIVMRPTSGTPQQNT
jgi:hypothetical protein